MTIKEPDYFDRNGLKIVLFRKRKRKHIHEKRMGMEYI